MFSCEFYKISKSTFFHRTPLVAASENCSVFVIELTAQKKACSSFSFNTTRTNDWTLSLSLRLNLCLQKGLKPNVSPVINLILKPSTHLGLPVALSLTLDFLTRRVCVCENLKISLTPPRICDVDGYHEILVSAHISVFNISFLSLFM